VLAPDLLGHGRSSWSAPWTIEANVAALADLLTEPALVVGHSFGAAVSLHLAAARPDLVSGLVLLDPAIGLDGGWMREIADAMFDSPDYTDAAEARNEKSSGSWADVDTAQLDTEVAEHLVELSSGRVAWRVSIPAMMSYWSELARDIVFPPNGIPITVVRAKWTSPPYVAEILIDGLRERADGGFRLIDLECGHMVPLAKPVETAKIIREHLKRRAWRP
jgi:lipase